MLSLREPTLGDIVARRAALVDAPMSAPADLIARTDAGDPPARWFADRTDGVLDTGAEAWAAATGAVRRWAFAQLGWVRVAAPDRIEVGALAAMVIRLGPVWSTNWCRIVEVIDEPDRFGFVYATLGDHAETGAERFMVTRDTTGQVRWELVAVSRPGAWFTWIGQPVVRALQARFRRDALAAMRRAVSSG